MWHSSLGYMNKLLLTPKREALPYLSNNSHKIQLGEPMNFIEVTYRSTDTTEANVLENFAQDK